MRSLVIDDEFVALAKMMAILNELGDCAAATHGQQGVEMVTEALMRGTPYDLITVDIEMPDMDGFAVLREIAARERGKGAQPSKKLLISAQSSTTNVARAARSTCDAFLVKPVKKDVLIQKLKSVGLIDG
jgi:two-component system chemotaxis response regulator CheY